MVNTALAIVCCEEDGSTTRVSDGSGCSLHSSFIECGCSWSMTASALAPFNQAVAAARTGDRMKENVSW